MGKRVWITLLLICVALFAAACGGEAASPSATGAGEEVAFTLAGEGTQNSPYLIATKEDLLQLAGVMNHENQCYDYMNSHFRLTADIALNDCADFDAWEETPPENVWTPIGYYQSFQGVFDGNGHTVSGLYINRPVTERAYGRMMDKFGLFGKVDGEIKNLTVENAYVHPKYTEGENPPDAGIIAGYNSGTIRGCTVKGTVICEGNYAGGIVGGNFGEVTDCSFAGRLLERSGSSAGSIGGIAGSGGNIRNCTVSAQILCEKTEDPILCAYMGGIAGIHSGFSDDCVIENCTFSGEIRSGHYAGGIVGYASAASFRDNAAKTVIRNCTNNGTVTAAEDGGGIVGLAMNTYESGEILVDGCTNSGPVRSLNTDICAVGGIVGHIDIRKDGPVTVTGCTNEAELRDAMPGGIVGRLMQKRGTFRMENCTNKGAIISEGSYAAGILCHIQQWGDNWSIVIDRCVNEGDITTAQNAGGIVCFACDVDADGENRAMFISDCVNRGNLRSDGINNYMGGILGVNAMAKAAVNITDCMNAGQLEYTNPVEINAETLSGVLFTLSRTAGGIVGYVGTAPYLTINSGERTVSNINVDDAYLTIENCTSTGRLIHKEPRFAQDVYASMGDALTDEYTASVMSFFISVEGGIVGTVADSEDYSVKITRCTFENAGQEIGDWIPHDR